ncbi:MAG: hypothetical protein ACRD9Q_03700 [Nitrososphaeraceae archaeon]
MSEQLAKREHSPFQEIVHLLRNEDFPYYAGWKFVEKRDGQMCYCAMAFLAKKKGISDWKLRLHFIGNVLEKYGFSKEELIKERMCTVEGCKYPATLEFLIMHLNVKHRLPPKKIADYVEKIENDTRKLPPWWKKLYYEWKFSA